jgi:transposase
MLLIGIDQSPSKHDVCIMDVKGCQLAHLSIPNSAVGFEQVHTTCQELRISAQDCLVALESEHNLLVDYLLDHGYPVYVIPGKAVDRYRDRHRQSRSCSDSGDAEVLAHVLRTDRELHKPWQPDSPLTRQIRSQVSVVYNLTRNVVRLTSQLRDLLWRYYPVAAELFCDWSATVPWSSSWLSPLPRLPRR